MKIVQYMLGFRNADGGVVRAVIDLCNALAGRGHEVVVLTTDTSDAPRDWDGQAGRPALRTLAFSRWTRSLVGRGAVAQARQAFAGADVIHLHVPWDPICAQLGRVAKRMGIPYVLALHGMLDDWTMASKSIKKRLYLVMFGRRLLEGAAFVQCSAQAELEQSRKWYPRGRSAVVSLLFELHAFERLPGPELAQRKFTGLTSSHARILYVGRLHPIKRIEMLIEAASLAKTPARVFLAGSGDSAYEKHLRDEAARRGLADRVFFLGFITGEEKLSLYQAADVLVHPSAHESFGFVTVEALACGTPVITTKAVNIWPELQSSDGALIVDQSPQAIASAIESVIDETARAADMGQRGRQWVFDTFNSLHVVTLYENMYRDATGA